MFSQPTYLTPTDITILQNQHFTSFIIFLRCITHYLSCFLLINGFRSQSGIKSIWRWVKAPVNTILQLFQWLCLGLLRVLKQCFSSYMLSKVTFICYHNTISIMNSRFVCFSEVHTLQCSQVSWIFCWRLQFLHALRMTCTLAELWNKFYVYHCFTASFYFCWFLLQAWILFDLPILRSHTEIYRV